MAYSNKPWSGQESRFDSAESYCASCLIDENPAGKPKVKDLCHLPVKEPGGAININALGAALAALNGARAGGVKASSASKAAARAKLMRMRSAAGLDKKKTAS